MRVAVFPNRIEVRNPWGTQTIIRDGRNVIQRMTRNNQRPTYTVKQLPTVAAAKGLMLEIRELAARINPDAAAVKVA